MKTELIYREETYAIRNACFEVYKDKGCGFTEPIYQECLELELGIQGIPFDAQKNIALTYKGRRLKRCFVPDLICFEIIIIELKAVSCLTDEHRSQIINYLKATGMKLGLLINFGADGGVQIERFAN